MEGRDTQACIRGEIYSIICYAQPFDQVGKIHDYNYNNGMSPAATEKSHPGCMAGRSCGVTFL